MKLLNITNDKDSEVHTFITMRTLFYLFIYLFFWRIILDMITSRVSDQHVSDLIQPHSSYLSWSETKCGKGKRVITRDKDVVNRNGSLPNQSHVEEWRHSWMVTTMDLSAEDCWSGMDYRKEYLMSYNFVWIICTREEYLIS